jgi:hypothetical protein
MDKMASPNRPHILAETAKHSGAEGHAKMLTGILYDYALRPGADGGKRFSHPVVAAEVLVQHN